MLVHFDPASVDDYKTFLKVKALPQYRIVGRSAWFPDEYAKSLGLRVKAARGLPYNPVGGLFDYQADISKLAIAKRKFAVFADCGLGKTLIMLEFARHALEATNRIVMIVSPLMVVRQTMAEAAKFYGGQYDIEQVSAARLQERLNGKPGIIITNYEAMRDELQPGNLGALILDESSMLKSHYGKWGTTCIRMGRGLEFKLALTGTPAPNDRIEYANHAVFLDQFPTINAFLARYFVNRGQTDNRWELKPHALIPFYRQLSAWCIFLHNPATYGWKDNSISIPPTFVHVHDVGLTDIQRELVYDTTDSLFADRIGGITSRSVLSQIAKGSHKGDDIETLKPPYIRKLVESWPEESTIIWCKFNAEQDRIAQEFPQAASISGATPDDDRFRMIDDFIAGRVKVLISKPKILGFGLNLQVATRQVFSGLQDSYEEYYQAIKRSNRVGSTRPLNVHIPITDIERPMLETVLRKAHQCQQDTEHQERIFKDARR